MKRRILVIEDDDLVRDTVQLLLEYKGYEVKTSSNGLNITPLVEDFKPHLVLTDIFLGENDGRIICHDIKSNPKTKDIPVIIMSGSPDIYNSIAGVGANDIVLKPFDEQTLMNRLQRQLTA
jgi:DNA-binding response OmpR family regulator